MMSHSYELSDINSYSSQTALTSGYRKSRGCHITVTQGIVLVLVAISVAVGVGIIVHFAGKENDSNCTSTIRNDTTLTAEPTRQKCLAIAQAGDDEICKACSGTGCPVTTATATTSPGTTVARTTTVTPTALDVRIPETLEPVLYTLELQPNMYDGEPASFTFNGSVKIEVLCKMATNQIMIHVNKINITSTITVVAAGESQDLYSSHSFDPERQFLVIATETAMLPGHNYTVAMSFSGPLASDLAGLYLSSYQHGDDTRYLATTLFAPVDARKAFPCFDEPALKAQFDVTLVRREPKISLSNMPLVETSDRGGGWFADRFQRTLKMSTYLLAFVICDFEYKENVTANNVTLRSWSRPLYIDQTPYSVDVGVKVLDYFEEYFNISYPLPKQDMIAVPDFAAGAMENWGLITYRESTMLYVPGVSSEGNKQTTVAIVAHELAHQWFGNLVTPSWWDDLWLNEGFAKYIEFMGAHYVHPDWKMFEQFVVLIQHKVMAIDGLHSSHPVYVPVYHPDEINEIFDLIAYYKGASIIRMMRFFLGDDTFRKGLYRYLTDRAYSDAFHDDLWFALGNQSLADGNAITDVKGIMDTWTLQMNYPVVHVTFNTANQISLSQSRYLQDPHAKDSGKYTSPFGYKWKIPFTFTTSSVPSFSPTISDIHMISQDIPLHSISNDSIPEARGDNWVLGNVNQYGYYRVNYDDRNWGALISQLKRNHTVISAVNRAQIMNDAWNLASSYGFPPREDDLFVVGGLSTLLTTAAMSAGALLMVGPSKSNRSGNVKMGTALGTLEYLGREREYVPWVAASRILGFVGTMLQHHYLYGPYSKFVQKITADAFKDLSMNNTGASHLESFLRSTVSSLACQYGTRECIEEAKTLFSRWMKDPKSNPVDPGLKSTVYCTAVEEGGVEESEFAYDQYKKATVAAEKSRLLSAMACTRKTWLLSRYLDMSLNPDDTRRQDSESVFSAIAGNPIGKSLAWDFFRTNWDTLFEMYKSSVFILTYYVKGVTNSFSTSLDLQQLEDFMEEHPDLGSGARAFQQAVEKTRSNIHWMAANAPIIKQWLKNQ